MPIWLWLLDSLALLLVLAALAVVGLAARRRYLARGGSTFDLSVNQRPPAEDGDPRGWTLGVGRYHDSELQWFRTFSFSWRPVRTFPRGHVEVVGRRAPVGQETYALHQGSTIIECEVSPSGEVLQLAMSPPALTGLLAWLESSPPGREVNNVI